ncbi:hypothetical protein WJX81_005081 [Elliptochloris bilobata]|uniref:Major facilitator superfamily (MFS) profile domain-containing protein n=1 Tax=Elliptochloris bilobata TaxID=381761 RepID=A0AAW1QLY6_9CHLO
MVRDFARGEGKSEQQIGALAGLLAAAGPFPRSISSFPWGMVSDRIGRKIVVVIGSLFAAGGIVLYGASTTFTAAFLARFIPGIFNGTAVALKSMIGESCDASNQARAMAILTLGFSMGTVTGPALGGLLAEPCAVFGDGFPLCGAGQLFAVRPFLLPTLVAGIIGVLAVVTDLFLMEETLPKLEGQSALAGAYHRIGGSAADVTVHDGREANGGTDAHAEDADVEAGGSAHSGEPPAPHRPVAAPAGTQAMAANFAPDLAPPNGDAGPNPAPDPVPSSNILQQPAHDRLQSVGASPVGPPLGAYSSADRGFSAHWQGGRDSEPGGHAGRHSHPGGGERVEEDEGEGSQGEAASGAPLNWHQIPNVRLALMGSGVVAFLWNYLEELTPIYISAPIARGGLGLSLSSFTPSIIFGGVVMAVFSLTYYPAYQRRVGPLNACKAGLWGGIPCAMLIPFAYVFVPHIVLEQAVLFLAMGLKAVFKIISLTSSTIIINLAAPRDQMGAVNGMAMALASLSRALGPAVGGMAWAVVVSLPRGLAFAGFAAMGVACALTQLFYRRVSLD